MKQHVIVIDAGIAGIKAAWHLAKRGIPVHLYEMITAKHLQAHHINKFVDLVCSNSIRVNTITNGFFELFPPFEPRIRNKKERKKKYAELVSTTIQNFVKKV
ncbi:FAD-dependent oxidoreductase [Evansella halocellulosilytica]|uniref:FAD-dependent oxidoreductase n=1 Tax=Evansella halocellulosilytica TaxID=2011013 RepID=UPI000BB92545